MSTRLLEPTAIDVGFVPRFRTDVVAIPVEDGAVLYEEDTGRLHQLDPIATVVCGCFDGEASLAATVAALAEVFGTDPEIVQTDVLDLARRIGRLGLLEGVQGELGASLDDVADR